MAFNGGAFCHTGKASPDSNTTLQTQQLKWIERWDSNFLVYDEYGGINQTNETTGLTFDPDGKSDGQSMNAGSILQAKWY